jgi:uncharacterized protein (UPF0262 family)
VPASEEPAGSAAGAVPPAGGRDRIARITLEESRGIRLSPQIENERRVAIYDLLHENHFALTQGGPGPYHLTLSLQGDRLAFIVASEDGDDRAEFGLLIGDIRRIIKEYFLICDSYLSAIRTASRSQIEAIDMGRRGLHNEGAELLRDRLAPYASIDHDTARRLFTLVVVLHIRK